MIITNKKCKFNLIFLYKLLKVKIFLKKLKKDVDKSGMIWYYVQVATRERPPQKKLTLLMSEIRTLKIKQRQSKEPDKIL